MFRKMDEEQQQPFKNPEMENILSLTRIPTNAHIWIVKLKKKTKKKNNFLLCFNYVYGGGRHIRVIAGT